MFVLEVKWSGKTGQLRFDKGKLTGPTDFMRYVRFCLKYTGEHFCTSRRWGESWPRKRVLKEEVPCYFFLQQVFEQEGLLVEGTAPEVELEPRPR
jgi:hypothetical protein